MYNYSYNIIYIKVFLLIQIEIIDISQQNTIDWVYSQARCAHYTYEAEANAKSLYAYLINGILEMNVVSNQSLCNTINNQNKPQPCILHYFRAISW